MGMISRVRARLRSIHTITNKLDARAHDERTTQAARAERRACAVCLVSAALLLPCLARGHAALLVAGVGLLAYSCLLLPMALAADLKTPPRQLLAALLADLAAACLRVGSVTVRVCGLCAGWAAETLAPAGRLLRRLYSPLERTERAFLRLSNISTMVSQLVFFAACERALLPTQRVTCLYSLMFYNVIAYCAAYIKELIEKEDWSPYVAMAEHSNIKHLAMSATKIVLEWTKAVTFIITVVFMLLVFGLEQGLQYYQPTTAYTCATGLYYLATEKVFVEVFPGALARLQLETLESLEPLWAPVLLRALTLLLAGAAVLGLALRAQWRAAAAAAYLLLWLRARELADGPLRTLTAERAALDRFRAASADELAAFDDVCAVCLSGMRAARVTPCHHIFHADCLRQCLKTSDQCPLCKRELKLD